MLQSFLPVSDDDTCGRRRNGPHHRTADHLCNTFFQFTHLGFFAARFRKKSPDQLALPWTLATLGGTLLWSSVGECSWHFGLNVVSDEGEIIFTNFPRIESIQGFPFMILTLLALVAVRKKAPFPLMSYALAFVGNWYGHLCMMGLYPIAMACGMKVELPVFTGYQDRFIPSYLRLLGCF